MSAKKGENICPKQTVGAKKIPGKLFGTLLGKRFMRVYVRKNFPPTGQKIIACGQHICPKEKTGQALFGLLGLNTVYELPAGQLFFSRGDVLRTLCYTPQTKRQKFQEGPTEEARSSEMPNITFDTSFGSYVTSDKTSDCELILSLCDQARKGAETVRVFPSSR